MHLSYSQGYDFDHQELPSDGLYFGVEDWPYILVAIHANHGSSNEKQAVFQYLPPEGYVDLRDHSEKSK